MTDSNFHLHIDRLILNDVTLSPSQRHLLQAAIEAELTHLLTEGATAFSTNQTVSSLAIAPITPAANSTPAQLGQQIAQNIYQGMNPGISQSAKGGLG
jgi:hypothetical protein